MHLIYALTISSTPAALDFFFVALSSTDLSSLSTIVPLCNEKQGIILEVSLVGVTYFGLSDGLRSSSRSMSIIESSLRLSETAGDARIIFLVVLKDLKP